MHDRRQRILTEAQALLDEKGYEGFTIRELSRRADVAQRTLYNVFGSKEDIVACAIWEHYAGLVDTMPEPPDPASLDAQLDRLTLTARVVISLRRYATAMVGVFFSPGVDRRIHDSLYRISMTSGGNWVDRAEKAKVLVKLSAAQRQRLIAAMVNLGYANVTDWAAGRIDDAEYILRAKQNFLLVVRAYLRPKHRAAAEALLAQLAEAG
jgi:AcrR family transcriptional regulator